MELTREAAAPRSATASFVVRLVTTAATEAEPCWRGQIVHVQSGVVAHFGDPAALLAFMAEHGGATPATPAKTNAARRDTP